LQKNFLHSVFDLILSSPVAALSCMFLLFVDIHF
jgi:hypothetical protein